MFLTIPSTQAESEFLIKEVSRLAIALLDSEIQQPACSIWQLEIAQRKCRCMAQQVSGSVQIIVPSGCKSPEAYTIPGGVGSQYPRSRLSLALGLYRSSVQRLNISHRNNNCHCATKEAYHADR